MKQFMTAVMVCLLVACGKGERPPEMERNERANILRTALSTNPMSLDPRHGGNRVSQVVVRMLFEGLCRINPEGEAELAMADGVEISDCGTVYTFHIRDALWSDGTPVTAHDFVYSWTKLLSPDFDCRFAYAFFTIKNARSVKLGDLPVDALGVRAIDEKTLVIELEHPAPYFLDHIANPICAPVQAGIEERNPRWADSPNTLVCNGTFVLEKWAHDSELKLRKNANYWDAKNVAIDGIDIAIIDDSRTSLVLFEQGKLDYLGEPFADIPVEALDTLRGRDELHVQEVNGLYGYIFNCNCFPFTSAKMRQAFSCVLDREQIVNHLLKRDEGVATSVLPPALTLHEGPLVVDGNAELARRLFAEGLEELAISREELPEIVITYGQLEGFKAVAQAIQQCWQDTFDVSVKLEGYSWATAYSKFVNREYMVGSSPYYSWYDDPIYNLELFKHSGQTINLTGWEDPVYIALLDCADQELDLAKRDRYLRQAEQIFMEAMPLTPIHLIHYKFIKNPEVEGEFISSKGMIDFKWARLGGVPHSMVASVH